jgi:hypothetical protein
MNSSPTDAQQQGERPKKSQIGRRYAAAGVEPSDAATPPAEPATLVTR